jgi:ubiquinone/menaquinone biosynthesis C-methylase UbiE
VDWTETYFEDGYLKRWGPPPPREKTRAQVADLLALLNPAAGSSVVDVGCGRGNFAAEIAAAGFAVAGIDASRSLLRVAARHARDCGVAVDLVCGDMRELPLRSRFGAALLLDSFGFFEQEQDNARVLTEARRVMRRGARLVIAVANAMPIMDRFQPRDIEHRGQITTAIVRVLHRRPAQIVEQLTIHDGDAVTHYERRQRLYTKEEVVEFLNRSGFAVVDAFSDYARVPFAETDSAKLVIVAEAVDAA